MTPLALPMAILLAMPNVPGAVNPAVTQSTLATTICSTAKDAHGHTWIHNQRPPVSYTNKLKAQKLAAMGLSAYPMKLFELDHRVPIEDGGNPSDPQNLYPEPWNGPQGAHRKDVLETFIHRSICKGTITLDAGRAVFLGDWTEGYRKYIGPLP